MIKKPAKRATKAAEEPAKPAEAATSKKLAVTP